MSDSQITSEKLFQYYKLFFDELRAAIRWGRDNLLLPVSGVSLLALILFLSFGVPIDKHTLIATCWVYGLSLLFLMAIAVVRAPWKLDRKRLLEIEELRQFKKQVEDSQVRLDMVELIVRNVNHHFPDGDLETAFALRLKIVNRSPRLPAKTAHKVLAKVTYLDEDWRTFTQYGRWADSDQPESLGPLVSKDGLLAMDFLPGAEHELDIAAKFPKDYSCYAVNNDSFPKIRLDKQQLDGPIVTVKVELFAEHVREEIEFPFTNQQSGKGFLVPV